MSTAETFALALAFHLPPGWRITRYNPVDQPAILRLVSPDGTHGLLRVADMRLGNEMGPGSIKWARDMPEHRGAGGLKRLAAYLLRCVEAPADEVSDGR